MRKLAVMVPMVWALGAPGAANAQSYEAPPPIDVPTNAVPQGPVPPPPPPPKKEAPKPAPVSAPKKEAAPKDEGDKGDKGDKKAPPVFNNDGVFKVSGTGTNLAAPKGKPAGKGPVGSIGKAAKKDPGIVAEWPGFRMTEDGGSEVLVEFSKSVGAPTRFDAAGSVTFVFKGAIVLKHNNQNPLITLHFNTPVASARLIPKKGEVHLVIDLRAGASAAPANGLRPGGDPGSLQFFAKFASGAYVSKDADDEPMLGPNQKLKGGKDKGDDEKEPPKKPVKKPKGGAKGPTE